MKKNSKLKKYLIFTIIISISFISNVFAYGYDVSVTSNSVTIGNNVTLTIKGSGIAGRFNISSSNTNIATLSTGSVWVENDTQSITINTKNIGTTTITIAPSDITTTDSSAKDVTLNKKTINITVNKKIETQTPATNNKPATSGGNNYTPKPKSSNSYLSSLTIDNFELDSSFDKQTLEYTATVTEEIEKIKINAQLEDSNAKVTGTGEVNVSVGVNNFDIIVTAENGSKRTYNLKVTVKEFQPIEVKIDNKTYNIVRKRKDLPVISEYFKEKDIIIEDNQIEGYYNEDLKYNLVGLKDNNGDIKYYIYDDNKYELYNEQVFNGMVLRILDKELKGQYKKTNFSYNNQSITSYQEVKIDLIKNTYALGKEEVVGNDYYLFYAINLDTGKEELYQFDQKEKTIQRYNLKLLNMYKDRSDKYYLYLLASLLTLGIVIIVFSTIFIRNSKKNKKLKKELKFLLEREKELKEKKNKKKEKKKTVKEILEDENKEITE